MSITTFYPTSEQFSSRIENGRVIIVTRTKNRPVLLARAFASMLSQTYTNWHLYLVNDGGEVGPVAELLDHYKESFKNRITVKHHPASLGMEAASNSALEGAVGEYLVIHDDDDAWHPAFLEETVSHLESENNQRYSAVATNCEVVYEEIINDSVIEQERMSWGFWKERVDLMDQLRTNNFPPICLLIRKAAFDKVGPYNDSLPVLGDWDYNLRLLLIGDIATINKPLAYYHHRRSSNGSGTYGNSVTDGLSRHLDYQVLYRNSMLRSLLSKEPGFAGVLHVLLVRIEQLEQKLNHIHHDINHQGPAANQQLNNELSTFIATMNKLLRPLRWAWRKLKLARGFIRRLVK
jgi:glycosyltransferase involved in cell wall biosynthesis